jgi:predicted dehydrogenase
MHHGCHVLIEKPMALNVSECEEIIAASRRHNVKICVAHSDLFYPPFLRARELVAQGAIGDFMGMRIFLSTPTDYMTSREDHWAHRLPGGVIGETGPHVVYMTLAFINPIQEVKVHALKSLPYRWSAFEDYRIDLVGEKATSTITSIYTTDQWAAQVDIWGTEGMLKLDLELMSLVKYRRDTLSPWRVAASGLSESVQLVRDTVRTGAQVLLGRFKKTHDILIEQFIDSILHDTPSPVPAEEGREAVRVMNLIVEQLDQQRQEGSKKG